MRIVRGLGALGLLVVACGGGAFTLASQAGDDGGITNGDGGGGTNDGGGSTCPQPPPNLDCPGCGGSQSPECRSGAWVCPPAPPCAVTDAGSYVPPDAGHDAAPDASGGEDAGPCGPCDYATHYCEVSYGPPSVDGGSSVTYECLAACDGAPSSCTCVTKGPFCTCSEDGGDTVVTCPFHP